MKILGIAGSLRAKSFNRMLLEEARQLAPAAVELRVYTLADVPLYNADLDQDPWPAGVDSLKQEIQAADALLIATPEYNHGIPGVLKNALDWASRPAGQSVLTGKPVGIVGASPSTIGTARAQGQLKQVLHGLVMPLFPYGEVLVAQAQHKFSEEGHLSDEPTRAFIERYLSEFVRWIGGVSGS